MPVAPGRRLGCESLGVKGQEAYFVCEPGSGDNAALGPDAGAPSVSLLMIHLYRRPLRLGRNAGASTF